MPNTPLSPPVAGEVEALVKRLRVEIDSDAIYDCIISLRKQTKSDLPRLAMASECGLLDEERAEAADMIEGLATFSASAPTTAQDN